MRNVIIHLGPGNRTLCDLVGCERTYTPTPEDLGRRLVVQCALLSPFKARAPSTSETTVVDSNTAGTIYQAEWAETETVITMPNRDPFQRRWLATAAPAWKGRLSKVLLSNTKA